jgi:hypothetical protein
VPVKSNRKLDSQKEKQLLPILWELLKKNIDDVEFEPTNDISEQLAGSDFKMKSPTIFGDFEYHVIDAKAATDYIAVVGRDRGLPTFAMELASTQRQEYREGWAINNKGYYSKTEYFLFQWVFAKNNSREISKENISHIEIMIVPKDKLLNFIKNPTEFVNGNFPNFREKLDNDKVKALYDFMKYFYTKIKGIRHEDGPIPLKNNDLLHLKKGRLYLNLLNPKGQLTKEPRIVYTSKDIKQEQPMNIVIWKKPYLNDLSIYTCILKNI